MKFSENDVVAIISSLQSRLGENWQFSSQYLSSIGSYSSGVVPDLIISDPKDNNFIIEFKGLSDQAELPLATVPIIQEIKNKNKELNPTVILATSSAIPTFLNDVLAKEDIKVIKLSNVKDTVSQIISIVSP